MSKYLEVVPGEIKTKFLHQYLLGSVSPRPIAFASTIDTEGNLNLAPFSFFNVFSSKPPMLIFSPARRVRDNTTKHTLENIYAIPEVVVNVVSHSIVSQMHLASSEYAQGVDEFKKAGLTAIPSDLVAPYRVAESPVQMECKVVEIKPLARAGGAGQLIFAQVIKMHINRDILDADEMIDPQKIDLAGRMGGPWYNRASGDSLFKLARPTIPPGMGIDVMPEAIRLSSVLTGNDLGQLGMAQTLPTAEMMQEFLNLEVHGVLSGLDSADAYHKKAQEVLKTGDVELAWKILLAANK